MKRRDFIRTAALGTVAAGSAGIGGLALNGCSRADDNNSRNFNFNKLGKGGGIKLSFEPYELQLRHTFTVSSYSRKTTPGVQVRLDY